MDAGNDEDVFIWFFSRVGERGQGVAHSYDTHEKENASPLTFALFEQWHGGETCKDQQSKQTRNEE